MAALKIIDPQPIGYLGWVAAAAIVGFVGNEAVAWLQIRTGRKTVLQYLMKPINKAREAMREK